MARHTNDPNLMALDDIRKLTTRIEMQLIDSQPDLETIKSAARTIRVLSHRFARFKGFKNMAQTPIMLCRFCGRAEDNASWYGSTHCNPPFIVREHEFSKVHPYLTKENRNG